LDAEEEAMAVSLLVGTEKGLFVIDSNDRRDSWQVREPAHPGWQVYSLFVDRRGRGPVAFAGLSSRIYGAHLQRSDDCGPTWTAIEESPRFPEGSPRKLDQAWAVQAGPTPDSLWAGVAEAALFRSDDGGRTWTMNEGLEAHPTRDRWMPGGGGLCLHTIVPDAVDPDRLFVGISAVGVFRSGDGGRTWALKNDGVAGFEDEETRKYTEVMRCVHKFVQDPTEPQRLYQQNHTGVYRSLDAGDSWERIEEGLPSRFGFPMVMHPHRPRTLFIVPQESDQVRTFPGGRPGVYRTDDGGDHWVRTHAGWDEPSYEGVLRNSMTADGEGQPGIYVGTTGGEVYATFDDGERWVRLPGRFPRVESLAAITL
jgi:photosystem II stability/assembly factor-like uncharacterized protein